MIEIIVVLLLAIAQLLVTVLVAKGLVQLILNLPQRALPADPPSEVQSRESTD